MLFKNFYKASLFILSFIMLFSTQVLANQSASLSSETTINAFIGLEQNRLKPFAAPSSKEKPSSKMVAIASLQRPFTERDKVLLSAKSVKALRLSTVSSQYKSVMRNFKPSRTKRFVRVSRAHKVGDIIVMSDRRRLYLIVGRGRAIEFMIAVGRQGKGWRGRDTISYKRKWPEWRPTAEMREKDKSLKTVYKGGKRNPLGSRALYIGDTLYRIHGTNNPKSIGKSATSGCFRMLNKDVEYLYNIVDVGTKVIVN